MTEGEQDIVTATLRAAFLGEITVEEAADRLAAIGVTRIGIRSVTAEMPEGQGRN